MSLRRRLLDLLRDDGIRPNAALRTALDRFLAAVDDGREEAGEVEDEEDEDPDDAAEADDDEGDVVGGVAWRGLVCPFCGERFRIAVDPSEPGQATITDCEVCCRPIRVSWTLEDGRVGDLRGDPAS